MQNREMTILGDGNQTASAHWGASCGYAVTTRLTFVFVGGECQAQALFLAYWKVRRVPNVFVSRFPD